MTYKTDYHVHTRYSDGGAWPEEYVACALREGLSELGFSDHLVLNGKSEKWIMDPSLLDEYCERIIKLKENTRGLKIRIGVEADYFPGQEQDLVNLVSSYPFDYVIGSVHYMGDDPVDISPEYYADKDLKQLWDQYFSLTSKAASSGIFNFIGHPDLIRIFGYNYPGDPSHLYRQLAITLKKNRVAFEINTNGMNKPLSSFYPDTRFLYIFADEKVSLCINSDAHKPERVAQYFNEAYMLAKNAGFSEMATFKKGKMEAVKMD